MTRISWPSVFRKRKLLSLEEMVGFRGAFWSTQDLNRDGNQEFGQRTGQEGEEDSQRSEGPEGEAGQLEGSREKFSWAGILNARRLSSRQTKGLVFKV